MTMFDVLRIVSIYRGVGGVVWEQFEALLNGEDVEEQNPNAVRIIVRNVLPPLIAMGIDDDDLLEEIKEALAQPNVDG